MANDYWHWKATNRQHFPICFALSVAPLEKIFLVSWQHGDKRDKFLPICPTYRLKGLLYLDFLLLLVNIVLDGHAFI